MTDSNLGEIIPPRRHTGEHAPALKIAGSNVLAAVVAVVTILLGAVGVMAAIGWPLPHQAATRIELKVLDEREAGHYTAVEQLTEDTRVIRCYVLHPERATKSGDANAEKRNRCLLERRQQP